MSKKQDIPFAYRRDIPWNFELDVNGDLQMVEDVDAVNQSIYTILKSSFSDKPMETLFGANLESDIFEQGLPQAFVQSNLEEKIITSIREQEPSVKILSLDINFDEINRNRIKISIAYQLTDGITTGLFDEILSFSDLKR